MKLFRFLFVAVGFLILVIPIPAGARTPTQRVFHVEASRFGYAPAELKANPGDHVIIELASQDVVHGLSIDGYNLETSADPGQTARLEFTADRAGTFKLRCSVTCGSLHPFMIGKLQVGTNSLLWRAAGLAFLVVIAVAWRGWQ